MEKVRRQLVSYEKKTIDLTTLEQMVMPFVETYEEFADVVLNFEKEEILTMIKAKGRTSRIPPLAFQYRLQKHLLNETYHIELQQHRQIFHPAINLDYYFQKDYLTWKKDLPYLKLIDTYLKENAFPPYQVPAPERSYELVGDEKWIGEKGGWEVLERINLAHLLKIVPVSEPLMFAINPRKIQEQQQLHLVVENKTTYQALVTALEETDFSTLIYGRGKAIISSIEQFPIQYPFQASHYFFYFGDVDREGISIWNSLTKKQPIKLAMPFYIACVSKQEAKGKEYQRGNEEAIQNFLSNFSIEQQLKIRSILENDCYYPQEILKTTELQNIWRETDWTSMIYKN